MVRNNNQSNEAITQTEYSGFQTAFDFLNVELFEGSLPPLLITLQRKANSRGYFSAKRFAARKACEETVHELALNPDLFEDRSDEEIISTLLHEMAHEWQEVFGKPSRGRYHNREWADKDGGPRTDAVSRWRTRRAPHRPSRHPLHHQGRSIPESVPKTRGQRLRVALEFPTSQQGKGANSKTKFTCPECAQNAWAKRGTRP